jgi:hypothetical protein
VKFDLHSAKAIWELALRGQKKELAIACDSTGDAVFDSGVDIRICVTAMQFHPLRQMTRKLFNFVDKFQKR